MPRFADIHNVRAPNTPLSQTEILRALKFGIASEFEAIQIYQQIMESTDNDQVRIVLTDITQDEMHHAGALMKLLDVLAPGDSAQYAHGMQKAVNELGLTEK
ncbi:rubrerythrin [bacterium]|nr:rubrerythrin [bacterium]